MSDFERYEDENQGELFGADELIRLDQEAIARATKEVERVAGRAIGNLVDQVMDQGYQVIDASVDKQNLRSQMEKLASENGMEYQDVLQEMDEYYEITLDLSLAALKALLRDLLQSFPHALEPEELAEIARGVWEE